MSLLNSVLGSIGSGSRTPLPQAPSRASTATPPGTKTDTNQVGSNAAALKANLQNVQATALKRKYEGTAGSQRPGQDKLTKSSAPPDRPRFTDPISNASSSKSSGVPRPGQPATQPRAPPKGSYMDLMNQAKAKHDERASAGHNVGMIKHAASAKEHLSKVARRRREEELRAQQKGKGGRVAPNGAIKKPGQPPINKLKGAEKSDYKGTAKGSASVAGNKDKLPKEREELSYKGTAGLKQPPPNRHNGSGYRSSKKEDRYLDTDEEDDADSFIDDDEEEEEERHISGHRRDAPRYRYAADEDDDESDMEAGWDDVEDEERAAERLAKREDEKEKALEEKLRREKEARRKEYERRR